MPILRPAAAVECPGREAKGRRDVSERFPTAGQKRAPPEKSQSAMAKNRLRPTAAADPLPGLGEGRFRVPSACVARNGQHDAQLFARRRDEANRRARRFDEEIIRTVATPTPGLLAQLRWLSAFCKENTNGAGRRGSLLIQTIAAGIQRLRVSELPNPRPARGPPVDADRPPRELRAVARKGGLAYERHPPQ